MDFNYSCDDEKCKTCEAKDLCKILSKLEKTANKGREYTNSLSEKHNTIANETAKNLCSIIDLMAESLVRSGVPVKDIVVSTNQLYDKYSVMVQDFEMGSVTLIHSTPNIIAFGVKADDLIAKDLVFRRALKNKGGLSIG